MITNTPYMIQVRQTPVEELNIDGPALDLKIDFFPFFYLKPLSYFCSQDDNFSLSLLNELSHKYGIQTHLSHSPLPQKLEELRDFLRQEVKKELKIMEGAENLRKVATDKKSVSNVNVIVKKSNSKLTELQQELQELESQILVSQGHALNSSGTGTHTLNTFFLDKVRQLIVQII